MPDTPPARWMQWRVKLVKKPTEVSAIERRLAGNAVGTRHELPAPDGIRHGFVARIRQEIAAGTYDSEERWLAAEEMLLSRIEAGD